MGLRAVVRRWRVPLGAVAVLVAGGMATATLRRGGPPALATAEVTRGDFVEVVELRGSVRPVKSIIITAPMLAGDLQILKLAPNGSAVKGGDVVVEFDAATLRRTVQEKESELKQAQSELDQLKATATITDGEDRNALVKSQYDVERAKLDYGGDVLVTKGLVSRVDAEKAKLAIADAEQREHQAEVRNDSDRQASKTSLTAQLSKIAKVQADLDRAQRSLAALQVKAPADGIVNIMPNYRNGSMMGAAPEFRAGDSAWPGAEIIELPSADAVHFEARLDESDRGRLRPGQAATIRADAIPDHTYQAAVSEVSVLARVDFSSWPPVKNFDLKLDFRDADGRLRPGMSAAARIAVGRLPDMLLLPAEAIFVVDGRSVVYRLQGRRFVAVPVDVVKRSREQAAVKGAIAGGDRVALTRPDAETAGTAR